MKILQLCHKPPFPPVDGGAIAMNNVSQGILSAGHQLKIISVATKKHPVKNEVLSADYLEKTGFESVFIDTSISARAAILNLFTQRSYNIERFICNKLESKIVSTLKNEHFDIVILEGLFVAPYFTKIRKHFKGKIILRAHNLEHKIWERMAANAKNPLKKFYLSLLSKRLKSFEIKSFKRMDGICAMTKIDKDLILQLCPEQKTIEIPSGYILTPLTEKQKSIAIEAKSIFHIASMNWQPNIEAVYWFLNEIWPNVLLQKNETKLYLAGRNMPNGFNKLKTKGVNVIGEVQNAKDFYLSKEIMIVPLLSGSGMRIKIIEGMALGKVIVSTSIGAEGIACTHNKNILIADTAEEFSDCIVKVLKDAQFCKMISENAKQLIADQYNNDLVCKRMLDFISSL